MKRRLLLSVLATAMALSLIQMLAWNGDRAAASETRPTPIVVPTEYPYLPTLTPTPTPTPLPTAEVMPTPTPSPGSAPSWYHPTVWADVTLEAVRLWADVRCGSGYNVYLAHAGDKESCKWWPPYSVKVLTETQIVEPVTFYWADYLEAPDPGDETCIWWDCKAIDEAGAALHFQIIRERILSRHYFPLVMKG